MECGMFGSSLAKWLIVFSVLSICLGIATAESPVVAKLGWIIGTLISTLAGIAFGTESTSRTNAAFGGALIGGVSIAIGCGIAYGMRALPADGVVAATAVGVVTGCVGGLITWFRVQGRQA